jgi:hypothetical protein
MYDNDTLSTVSKYLYLLAAILPTAINRSEPSAPQTPGGSSTITNYAPITIRIDYVVESPSAGVIFVEPDPDVAPYVSVLEQVFMRDLMTYHQLFPNLQA